MIPRRSLRLASVGLLGLAAVVQAQQPAVKLMEEKPGLLARAKFTPDSATRIAQAQIPSGTIQRAGIEMEHGRLIYSYDVKVPGKSGIDEVNVDATTGKIVGVEHEGSNDEARERKADSRKAKP